MPSLGGARVVVVGVDEVVTTTMKLAIQGRFVLNGLLKELADELLEEALTLVPVDSGALYSTGKVVEESTMGGGFGKTYNVTFGDETVFNDRGRPVDYAVFVHEILSVDHPVGQAKYLEEPAIRLFAEAQSELTVKARAKYKFVNVGGGFGNSSTFTGGV